MAGRVPELEWGLLRLCRAILADCAEQVENLEEELEVPGCCGCDDRDDEDDEDGAEPMWLMRAARGCGCKGGVC